MATEECLRENNGSKQEKEKEKIRKRRDFCGFPWLPGFNLWSFLRCLHEHPTLPGLLHSHPSHPVSLGRRRRPSWAQCTTEQRTLRRRSSSPDPELFLHRPSWAGCSSGCCCLHCPSHLEPPLNTVRHLVGVPVLRGFVLATKGQGLWSNVASLKARGRIDGRMWGRCWR